MKREYLREFDEEHFAGFDPEINSYDKSKAAVLPVSYEGSVSYLNGTGKAPEEIIKASQQLEKYDEEIDFSVFDKGINTLKLQVMEGKPKEVVGKISEVYGEILKDKKFPVLIGGEHSLTLGAVKNFKDVSVLQLDAHADLYDDFKGEKYGHMCVGRRILDEGFEMVQVGVRNLNKEMRELQKEKEIPVFFAREIRKDKRWVEKVVAELKERVYVTIDMDVFKPGLVSTGTPEPGGLDWYEVLELLKKVCQNKKVVGFDVVELKPDEKSSYITANLVYKMLGYVFKFS